MTDAPQLPGVRHLEHAACNPRSGGSRSAVVVDRPCRAARGRGRRRRGLVLRVPRHRAAEGRHRQRRGVRRAGHRQHLERLDRHDRTAPAQRRASTARGPSTRRSASSTRPPTSSRAPSWATASTRSSRGVGAKTAFGRTPDVTGSLTIDGTVATAAEFTADLTTLQSDDSRRDGQLRNQGIQTGRFPTATFKLTQPIDFGTIPTDETTVSVNATGELTLHGVTKTVTIPLDAKLVGDTIVVTSLFDVTLCRLRHHQAVVGRRALDRGHRDHGGPALLHQELRAAPPAGAAVTRRRSGGRRRGRAQPRGPGRGLRRARSRAARPRPHRAASPAGRDETTIKPAAVTASRSEPRAPATRPMHASTPAPSIRRTARSPPRAPRRSRPTARGRDGARSLRARPRRR